MEMTQNNMFSEMTCEEMASVDGGLLGVTWLTWALLTKIFAGAVGIGVAGAGAYLANKK